MRYPTLLFLLAGCFPSDSVGEGTGGASEGTSSASTEDSSSASTDSPTSTSTDASTMGSTGEPATETGETGMSAPGCPAGDVELKTQADVLAVAGCTEFPGDVEIGREITDLTPLAGVRRIAGTLSAGTFNSQAPAMLGSFAGLEQLESLGNLILEPLPVSDLLPFSALTEITGMVSIRDLEVTSLEGLHEVTSVGSILVIEGCEQLVDLTGLRGLKRVGRKIDLYGLTALTDLHGLENLTEVGAPGGEEADVWLRYLYKLESLDGLQVAWHDAIVFFMSNTLVSDLGAFAGTTELAQLSLFDNTQLTDLAGLESLVRVGELYLDGNAITDVGALAGLQSIGQLRIVSEPLTDLSPLTSLATLDALYVATSQFTALAALPALQHIGHVALEDNAALTDLDIFTGVSSVDSLTILNNDALAALPGLSALQQVHEDFNIQDNAALTSLAEVADLTVVGGRLRILSNHALPCVDALAWAAGISAGNGIKVADNEDCPVSPDPCPWKDDGDCDEPLLCPEFSDGLDCCHGFCE